MQDNKEILRLRFGLGMTRNAIAVAVGVSAGTVSNILKRASAAGLGWPLPEDLDDEGLSARLYPVIKRDSDGGHRPPDWDAVIAEYEAPRGHRQSKLTQYILWTEYAEEAAYQGATAYS